MIDAIWTGAIAPFWGLRLLFTKPSLWLIAVIPFLVGLTWSGFSALQYITEQPTGGVAGVVASVIAAGFAILVILMQIIIALLSPLLDYLSERSERVLGQALAESSLLDDFLSGAFIPRAARALLESLKLLSFKLLISLVAIPISFIDTIGGGIAIVMVGLVLALDFLDYPMARRELLLSDKLDWLRQHWPSAVSFSLTCYALLMTPGIGGISFVPCIIGGTWLVCRLGINDKRVVAAATVASIHK